MRSSTLRSILLAPVFLYVAGLDFVRFAGWDPYVVLVIVAMALPFLELRVPAAEGRFFVPAWALAMISGIGLAQGVGAPTGWWAVVGAGVLLGAPITILAGLIVWRESVYASVLGIVAGLGTLLSLLAGGSAAVAGGAAPGKTAWIVAFSQVNLDQYSALVRWVETGGVTNATPFGAISDPAFIGLAIVAGFSMILALLERPPEAGAGPRPTEPLFPRSSGVAPLVSAAVAGLAFESMAALAPQRALLGLVVGVLGTLVALGLLTWLERRPSRGGIPAPRA